MIRPETFFRTISLGIVLISVPLLVGAKGDGCGGGIVSIGGDTGGGEGGSAIVAGVGGTSGTQTGVGGSPANTGAGGEGGGQNEGGASAVGAIVCPVIPGSYLVPPKDCTTAGECLVKLHTINCCGTRIAIGVRDYFSADFDAWESVCEATYPACGCPTEPTKAEDGNTTPDNNLIQVDCISGSCMTFIP